MPSILAIGEVGVPVDVVGEEPGVDPVAVTFVKPFGGGDEVLDEAAGRAVDVGRFGVAAVRRCVTPYDAVNSCVSGDLRFGSMKMFAVGSVTAALAALIG